MTTEFSQFAARLREFINSSLHAGDDVRSLDSIADCEVGIADFKSESPYLGCCEDEFGALSLELFALQFAHNEPYRRFCEARAVSPETVADWREIPAVPTAAFKELELSCLPVEERTTIFRSSGTTGQRPSRHFHSAESLAIYEESVWPWFAAHVLAGGDARPRASVHFGRAGSSFLPEPGGPMLFLTPPPREAPYSSLVYMFETVRRKLGAPESVFVAKAAGADSKRWGDPDWSGEPRHSKLPGSSVASPHLPTAPGDGGWTLDFDAALAALRQASESDRPVVVLGTAFSFVHLLDSLAERNLRFALPLGSRVMETGGYKGRSRSLSKGELYALISRRLGVPPSRIVCEYGMSELSSQAYDSMAGDEWRVASDKDAACHPSPVICHFHFAPWARAQIVSPETGREVAEGETGLIQVFDLANVFSVMAIQTEDLGIRRDDGFELLGLALLAEPRGCSLMSVESLNR